MSMNATMDGEGTGGQSALVTSLICLAGALIGGAIALVAGAVFFWAGMTAFESVLGGTGIRGWLAPIFYFVWVIMSCGAAAWVFREVLRRATPELTAKPARQAPLTASFGILVILIYVICALFADFL
ncbi:MAG: hypothetical protein AAGH68_11885, partial [Pseudomonadota bacterium]